MLLVALVLPLDGPAPVAPLHVRGWFYGLIRELAPELHDAEGPRPFTLSHGGRDQPFIRLTFLQEDLYARLSARLYTLPESHMLLGKQRYGIKAVLQDGHPAAGLGNYARLFGPASTADAAMHFISPTFFRRQGNNYPLPEPKLVFASLISSWNSFAPLKVPTDIEEALTGRLTLRHLELRSRSSEAHSRTVGCLGRVTYHLPKASDEEKNWLSALHRFSFYSAVGAKTSLGYGQVRPFVHPTKAPQS